MKPFKSRIAEQLEAYIAYRRALGFTDKHLRSTLRPFDRFMEQTGLTIQQVNPLDLMAFKKSLQMEPRSINAIIIGIRGFFDYLIRIQILEDNPLKYFPLQRENAFVPLSFLLHRQNACSGPYNERSDNTSNTSSTISRFTPPSFSLPNAA